MRIVVNDKDITELTQGTNWSGDLSQNARKVSVKYLYSRAATFPQIQVRKGDTLGVYSEDGLMRFVGIVLAVESSISSPVVSLSAADVLWYMGKNKTYKVYEGLPQDIVTMVCGEFNVAVGVLPVLTEPVKVISTGDKSVLQVVQEAYGNDYYVYADKATVNVAKAGEDIVAVLTTEANVLDAKYKTSIESMVNRVAIINDQSALISYVQADADLKYGLLQEVYKQEKDKDAQTEAKKKLKSEENSSTLTVCPGDWNCTAGKAVYIKDVENLMEGVFLIKDDRHYFDGGIHKMELGVEVHGPI